MTFYETINSKRTNTMYWHRILGTTFKDFYLNDPFNVDLEKELKYPQFIDILIIELENETNEENKIKEQPDGLENLRKYNLITYKSISETLDSWVLDELISYYVLFRKIVGPDLNNLIQVSEFNLIAISTRFPQKLNKQEGLEYIKDGVYKLKRGEHNITIIVTSMTPKIPKNAIWQMFSGKPEQIFEGLKNYKWNSQYYKYYVSNRLIERYKTEGVKMAYTDQDIMRDIINMALSEASIEDRLKGLKPEDRLKGLKPEDFLKSYKPEDVLKSYKPEDVLKSYKPEDILKNFSKEELKFYLNKINIDD